MTSRSPSPKKNRIFQSHLFNSVGEKDPVVGGDLRALLGLTQKFEEAVTQKVGTTEAAIKDLYKRNEDSEANKVMETFGRKLPTFSGDGTQNFLAWREKLEDQLDAQGHLNAEQKAMRLKLQLEGMAREFYNQLTFAERTDYTAAIAKLQDHFVNKNTKKQAKRKLKTCAQGNGEPIPEYAVRVKELVGAATAGLPKEAQKEHLLETFLDNLRPELAYMVHMHLPESFEKAYEIAMNLESLRPPRKAEAMATQAPSRTPTDPCVERMNELFEKMAMGQQELLNEIRQSRRDGPPRGNFGRSQRGFQRFQGNNRGNFRFESQGPRGGFATNANRVMPYNPYGRPACTKCGKVGHFHYQCFQRLPPQTLDQNTNTANNGGYNQAGGQQGSQYGHQQQRPERQVTFRDPPRTEARVNTCTVGNGEEEIQNLRATNHALRQHNERLAELAYGSNGKAAAYANATTTLPKPHKPAKALLTTAMIACVLSILFQGTEAAQPMLCQLNTARTLWRLPDFGECVQAPRLLHPKVEKLGLTVYKPNVAVYLTKAIHCKKITTAARYYTDLVGSHQKETTTTEERVTAEECSQMHAFMRCEHGTLTKSGTLFRTHNVLKIDYPWAVFGSFSWKNSEATNCFVYETEITTRYGSAQIGSVMGNVAHCAYDVGSCLLEDNSILLWKPTDTQKCRYVEFRRMAGERLGTIWLSEDKEFALSVPALTPALMDCGHELLASEQGFAVLVREWPTHTRGKRGINLYDEQGLVLSGQLAAQLTAIKTDVVEMINFAFSHALSAACLNNRHASKQLIGALMANPTLAARRILNATNIQARMTNPSLLEVWPCSELEAGMYSLRPVKAEKKCYEFVPILIHSGTKQVKAYFDPVTMIVSHTSKTTNCDFGRRVITTLGPVPVEIDQWEGSQHTLNESAIRMADKQAPHSAAFENIPVTVFHNLLVTSLTDVVPSHHWATMANTAHMEESIRKLVQDAENPTDAEHFGRFSNSVVSQGLFGFLRGYLDPMQVWIFLCCLYCTWQFVTRVLLPRALRAALDQYDIPSTIEYAWSQTAGRQRKPKKSFAQAVKEAQNAQLSRMDQPIGAEANATEPSFSAQVPGRVNNVPVSVLIDTGSGVSLCPASLAPLFGVFDLKTDENTQEVFGASGAKLDIVGESWITLELGEHITQGLVYFINCKGRLPSYDILIGCDVLTGLPPIMIDVANCRLTVGSSLLPLGDPRTSEPRSRTVRALTTMAIEPHTEQLVPVYLSGPSRRAHCYAIFTEADRLEDLDATIPPTVLSSSGDHTYIIVANPTAAPLYIPAHMALAKAERLANANENIPTTCNHATTAGTKRTTVADPAFKVDLSLAACNGAQRAQLQTLIDRYADIFAKNQYDLGKCKIIAPTIVTTTEVPPKGKPHRVPYMYRGALQDNVQNMIDSEVMVESDTPWAVNSIVLVKKPDGTLRPCIDFRKLNKITVLDRYPLPKIETILEKIGGCKFYSSMDCASGYLQIRVDEETSWKLGVCTEEKTYQMKALPFGLVNASGIYSRAMSRILAGMEDYCVSYIDDILCFSRESFEEHLSALERVFQRFREFDMRLSPKKCYFMREEVHFLGHTIRAGDYKPAARNIEAIAKFPEPTGLQQVRRFVGMASFFRKFVPRFSEIASPLTSLTKKAIKFTWGPEQQKAFDELKSILMSDITLTFPDYGKPFYIFTDASAIGQSGVLMQKDENGNFKAISYCSRSMTDPERRQPATHAEMGAIIFAIRKFRSFIYMTEIILMTDHRPLTYLLNKQENNAQLARWVLELQEYPKLKIMHVEGAKNALADALSRVEITEGKTESLTELKDRMDFPVCLHIRSRKRPRRDSQPPAEEEEAPMAPIDMKEEQSKDSLLGPILSVLVKAQNSGTDGLTKEEKDLLDSASATYELDRNGCLYVHREEIVRRAKGKRPLAVPMSLQEMVFEFFHASPLGGGHYGYRKTLDKCSRYHWPKMQEDVKQRCQACLVCQMRRNPRPAYREPMTSSISNAIFAKVGIDATGPFRTTDRGNRYVINIICWFSKYLISVPVSDVRSITLANCLVEHVVLKYGTPTELISDNGAGFSADFYKELCAKLSINKRFSTPRHSQGNAATERSFRSIQDALSKMVNDRHDDWDLLVPYVTFCHNVSSHETTGESPFFMMHGRDVVFSVDQLLDPNYRVPVGETDADEFKTLLVANLRYAWDAAAERTKVAQERMRTQYDKNVRNHQITVGDRVLLKDTQVKIGMVRKFHLPWNKQFRVIEICEPHAILVSIASPQSPPKKVHLNQIKKCYEYMGPPCTSSAIPVALENALDGIGAVDVEPVPTGYVHDPVSRPKDTPTPTDQPESMIGGHRLRALPGRRRSMG